MQGKIIKGIAGFYYVYAEDGKEYECRAKGSFRKDKIKPLVGDLVELDVLNTAEQTGNLTRILPRKNSLIRPAVANVDQAMVLFAVKDPEPNLNLLDRFLIMMTKQHVPVKICFTKTDLTEDNRRSLQEIYESAGYEVCFISVYEKTGLDFLKKQLKGKTTVLAGPSGVGKSSLMNEIKPDAAMETGTLSEKIRRGKHTTRHSEFFAVDKETFILDTPGFSSIYIQDIAPEELNAYFPEFAQFEENCRFTGCVHIGERECGVKDALQEGRISKSRYDNYQLLYQELKQQKKY